MKKNSILKRFDFPSITDEIRSMMDKVFTDNLIIVKAETKKLDKEMVNVITFYCRFTNYNDEVSESVCRFYITKNDFLEQYRRVDGTLYIGKRDVCFYYRSLCNIIYDDNTKKVLDRMYSKILKRYPKYEFCPRSIVYRAIENIREDNRRKRIKIKNAKDKAQAEIDMKDFKTIKPSVPAKIKKEAVKKFLVYFFEEKGILYCTSCKKETEIKKMDKHLTERTCPCCNREGKVQRVSKCKLIFNEHFFLIDAEDKNGKLLENYYRCERYFYNKDYKNIKFEIKNVSRRIIDYSSYKITNYEIYKNYFIPLKSVIRTYFDRYSGIFRNYFNKYYNGFGYLTSNTIDILLNSEGFDYYNKYFLDIRETIVDPTAEDYYADAFVSQYYYHVGSVIEKMYKYGLSSLIAEFQKPSYMRSNVSVNERETSLVKIMKVNKPILRFIKKNNLDWDDVKILQGLYSKGVPFVEERATICVKTIGLRYYEKTWNKVRILNYFKKQYEIGNEVTYYEYEHYIENLRKLNITSNAKSDIYPKNFYVADRNISRQIDEELNAEQVKAVRLISEGLRKMEGIERFMQGSKGLLVKVPECPADLKEEGISLHNCIGTYTKSVSEGRTFIFFIRQIDAPDKPFFAMEYRNGHISQIHGNHNCNPDEEIKAFCNSFAKYLQLMKFEPKKLLAAA